MSLRSIILSFATLLIALSCGEGVSELRNGDLIFVGVPAAQNDAGGKTMDSAISAAIGKEGQLSFTHVAIAEVSSDGVWIIDAAPKRGVSKRSLESFLEENALSDGSLPVFVVKRVTGIDADAAVERAKGLCGRGYDFCFLPDNDELYCSELVQLCYLSERGEPVFESEPMNFLSSDGSVPPYWEKLFKEMGMAIPQGVPGTNPQRMSESGCLFSVPASLIKE